jgi:hypothetical protein
LSSIVVVLPERREYGMLYGMSAVKKITVHVSADVLRRAQKATGEGVTPTVRQALELLAAAPVYDGLRALRGKVKFTVNLDRLRDRSKTSRSRHARFAT